MAPKIDLDPYVQPKKNRVGKTYYYFRVIIDKKEYRRPLPHPFDFDYREKYNAAHREFFGVSPDEFDSQTGIKSLITRHRLSVKYTRLPKASKDLRELALGLMLERWGEFEAPHIKPVHVQAVYDSLSERPATANRRLDDISSVFGWGRTRGFCDVNPCHRIERIKSNRSYEPWPEEPLNILIEHGKPEIVKVALVATYTSQRRSDVLLRFNDERINGQVWYAKQGKTGNEVPVPLHPVVQAIAELERVNRRKDGIVDPRRPLLTNSKGRPWTPSGFGASWRKELIRLKLRPEQLIDASPDAPHLTFHGLRHTTATIIATSVARNPELFGGIARVKSMLGHLSESMSKHYARRAEQEHMNTETMLLMPEIGNTPTWIGNTQKK